ncbi:MAG: putative pyridoxine 5'-phosphate oxidase superfamily flavin-nucleotide-binding protein [Candidatus Paceibacteria bacterium]|jgi:predicted pyridoxine 5'-phosphate oxidase superfamily flavin-nucleotide-binding protein
MTRKYTQLTFTDSVKATQSELGSRDSALQVEAWDIDDEHLSPKESTFIAARDSFYMATVNEDGWPYVQFRGGPAGFLKVLDDRTLGYADFRGNRQYISFGNLDKCARAALFFMDYPGRQRLKLMATTEVLDPGQHPEHLAQLTDPGYRAQVERLILFHVVAFDWNCPQHITARFTDEEWAAANRS